MMAKAKDAGVYKTENGMWAYRFCITVAQHIDDIVCQKLCSGRFEIKFPHIAPPNNLYCIILSLFDAIINCETGYICILS